MFFQILVFPWFNFSVLLDTVGYSHNTSHMTTLTGFSYNLFHLLSLVSFIDSSSSSLSLNIDILLCSLSAHFFSPSPFLRIWTTFTPPCWLPYLNLPSGSLSKPLAWILHTALTKSNKMKSPFPQNLLFFLHYLFWETTSIHQKSCFWNHSYSSMPRPLGLHLPQQINHQIISVLPPMYSWTCPSHASSGFWPSSRTHHLFF